MVADARRDVLGPGPGMGGLAALLACRLEGQPDHERVDGMGRDEREQRGRVDGRVPTAAQGHERSRAAATFRDRHTDPPLTDIEPEQARGSGHGRAVHGPAVHVRASRMAVGVLDGVSTGSGAVVRTSTRASSVGIVPTQSGQTDSSTVP